MSDEAKKERKKLVPLADTHELVNYLAQKGGALSEDEKRTRQFKTKDGVRRFSLRDLQSASKLSLFSEKVANALKATVADVEALERETVSKEELLGGVAVTSKLNPISKSVVVPHVEKVLGTSKQYVIRYTANAIVLAPTEKAAAAAADRVSKR